MASVAGIDAGLALKQRIESPEKLSDEQTVTRILEGDEDSFRALYDRYHLRVSATVGRIIRDREDTQDVTQEVFAKVFRSLSSWDPARAKFSTWLYRLAANHAIDWWRARRRNTDLSLDSDEVIWDEMKAGLGQDRGAGFCQEADLEMKETVERIRRSVNRLPPLQKKIFFLRHFRGFKLNEIAALEGHKLATVKTSLYRATQVLRRRLQSLSDSCDERLMPAV